MAGILRVLGAVTFEVDGQPVALGGNRQRAILAYLALHHDRSVPIGVLIDEVWGDEPPVTVVKSLSTLVSRLRLTLEPSGHLLLHDGSGYRLQVPEGGLDLITFREAVVRSRIAEVSDDVVEAIAQLRIALYAWTGPALHQLDAPFVASAVEGLAVEIGAAVDGRARLLMRVGDHEEAIRLLESALAHTPHREDRWAALVQAHHANGADDEAVAAYERAAALFEADLGLAPGEALVAARAAIDGRVVGGDTALRPDGQRTIGRDVELAQLEANAAAASGGGRRVQLVLGEAGSGKSHLVRALADRLGARGLPVLIGRCDPMSATPLGPVLEAIRTAVDLGVLPGVPFAGFPAVATALRGEVWSDSDAAAVGFDSGDLHRRRIFAEVAELAALLGRDHPVIVAIEDLHWADPFTLSVLHHLAHQGVSDTIYFIATARTPEFASSRACNVLEVLASVVSIDTMELAPLSDAAVRELVTGALPDAARTPEVLREVARGSGGNPLYALHLAHHIAEHGVVVALEGPLPADSLELFGARVRSLSPRAAELIAVGATLGPEFALEHLNQVFREGHLTLMHRVNDARLAGLIEPADAGRYRFVHGLVRRAAYESQDGPGRARLHVTAARLLGHGDGTASIEIAEHLWRGRSVVPADEVATAIVTAARPAIGFGALDAAEELLRRGLTLAGVSVDVRTEVQVLLGDVLLANHQPTEGQQHILDGRELARSIGRWDLYADAVLAIQRLGVAPTIEEAEAHDLLVDAALAQPTLDAARRIQLFAYRADLLVNIDLGQASAALEAARALLAEHPSPPLARRLDWLELRRLEASSADPLAATAQGVEMMERSRKADDLVAAAQAANAVQRSRIRAGRFRDVLRDNDAFRALAGEAGRPEIAGELWGARVAAVMATEPVAVADAESERLAHHATGLLATTVTRLLHVWVFQREQLRLHEMGPALEFVAASSKRVGVITWFTALQVEQGHLDEARALQEGLLDRLIAKPHDWTRVSFLSLMADIDADLGRTDDADRLYDQLLPAAGQVAVMAGAAQVLGRVDRYLGRLAHLRGDLDGAIAHHTDARELDRASGAGLWVAWAAHDEAAARLARGTDDDDVVAAALLTSAATTAKRYGSRRLTSAVRVSRGRAS